MTIKTENLLQSELKKNNINRISDTMQKRGAVRNLFGSPDRSELQRHVAEHQNEQNKKIDGFKFDSVIGIMWNPKDQAKRLKTSVQSDSESDGDSDSPPSTLPIASTNQGEASSSASSSSSSSSTENLSSSNDSANTEDKNFKKIGSPRILARGQRTIKSKNQKSDEKEKDKSIIIFCFCIFFFTLVHRLFLRS